MRLVLRALTAVAATSAGLAGLACSELNTEPNPDNLRSGTPANWSTVGRFPTTYSVGRDRNTFRGGKQGVGIVGRDTSRLNFSGIGQFIRADDYLGKRVRLRAWTRSFNIQGTSAGLWMRIDGPGVTLGFDNFESRPLLGTSDWRQVEIILDVPTNAIGIAFGALMSGRGELFVDEMSFEVIPASGPTTNMLAEPLQVATDSATTVAAYVPRSRVPLNLDFEQ